MSAESIYNSLRATGLTHAGACGMMGNLMAESSLIANIAQRGMTKLTDEEYTAKFDRDPVSCYRDGVGYGLPQLTFWSRKKACWEFAHSRGKSVGDEETQVEFIIYELKTDFPGLYSFLCSTDDMYEATARVCKEYERPAINNIDRRYEFAKVFDKDLGGSEAQQPIGAYLAPDQSILILQAVLVANGYNVELTGHNNAAFLKTLRQFVADIGG
jgi:hypothetical protein